MPNLGKKTAKERLLATLDATMRRDWRDGVAVDRTGDELDEVRQAIDQELELAIIERDAALASQVRLALQRLEQGEYGTCIRCGQEIDSRRLSAVPWASRCLTCQRHAEAEQHRVTSVEPPSTPTHQNGRAPGRRRRGGAPLK